MLGNKLIDLLINQTSLELVKSNGDLTYEGEIVEYRISPTTATARNTADQNRLTVSVNVRFINKYDGESDFEKRFSFLFFENERNILSNLNENDEIQKSLKNIEPENNFLQKVRDLATKKGIIFCSISEAIQKHPDLVKKYLGSVIPISDHYFATLNSAVFTDGSVSYTHLTLPTILLV